MSLLVRSLVILYTLVPLVLSQCAPYGDFARYQHKPNSTGRYQLSYQRPIPPCRTFRAPEVDETIERMKNVITDPDLYRLFENTFPNTLDTTIRWRGFASGSDEELSFISTGDINAMWLRDSANQLESYSSLLKANSSNYSLAGLFRGAINLQARYINEDPYCNAFQVPLEAQPMQQKASYNSDVIYPDFNHSRVFSCDYELDSFGSFLQMSTTYAEKTGDYDFFGKYNWTGAVETILDVAQGMRQPTYAENGTLLISPYTFTAPIAGSHINAGNGQPVRGGTGLVRSFFRPSDDPCIYQLLIPANMMFSRFLKTTSEIMGRISGQDALAGRMSQFSNEIRKGIEDNAIIHDRKYGDVYAYEIDGFGGTNMMDDANIPSLISAAYLGFVDRSDPIYQNTRKKLWSLDNPYFAKGPAISGIGGPHIGLGSMWPMSCIMFILTSDDDEEIVTVLEQLLSTTDGLGMMHESIRASDPSNWTRHWFAWANGLFGQMILDLERRKPHILSRSFQ